MDFNLDVYCVVDESKRLRRTWAFMLDSSQPLLDFEETLLPFA